MPAEVGVFCAWRFWYSRGIDNGGIPVRVIVTALAALALAGCDDDSKMEAVCKDIAREASVDPSSLIVNDSKSAKSDMGLSEVYSAISKKYGGNTPLEITRATDALVHREKPPILAIVEIDYTINTKGGKDRFLARCAFMDGVLPKAVLYSVKVSGKEFSIDKLHDLFLYVKTPKGLSSDYFLK
jgi:hypothetical protein